MKSEFSVVSIEVESATVKKGTIAQLGLGHDRRPSPQSASAPHRWIEKVFIQNVVQVQLEGTCAVNDDTTVMTCFAIDTWASDLESMTTLMHPTPGPS